MLYHQKALKFHCTGCGRCCFGNPGEHYIELMHGEAERICQFLHLDRDIFEQQYLVNEPEIGEGIRLNKQGRCTLLNEHNQCSVYSVRPKQCMTYPFWPELVHSHEAWEAEASRCEGINHGDVVATEYIEQQLNLLK